ncbi:hypothetical protein [Spiroplasma melliferum]|uniref:Translocator protein n=2 Tax=Spiroplasma melliferum TaxID=2134 RepID=A0AAI9T2T3_SPIME|nr:hypothetical protein [Spiroplasma melliferum]ELL44139.1 hypothetical protein SMIPMB4A_v3c8660 [Spiroplasma melliferum IPMB4A]KAI92270.1 translocator protein [Spiroplasma melliferum KC3]QCO23697.1 hypothetical protein SRED_002168 [Spiroplasma melliferum]
MKKFLMLLNAILFPVISFLAVCACKNINDIIVRKVPLTTANLTTFFEKNNVLEYTGEYFFKDADTQTENETFRMTKGRIERMFKSLLDQTLGQKIRKHFSYKPSEYYFKIAKLTHFPSYKLNQFYDFHFQLIIDFQNQFYFQQDNLVLRFKETKQYNNEKWLKVYLDYLRNCSTYLWQRKYLGYEKNGSLPYHPDAQWTSKNSKVAFTKNNDTYVLNLLSDYYANLWNDVNITGGLWFYKDKQFHVNVIKYEYLGKTPARLYKNNGARAKITLTFTSKSDNRINATASYEIWMEYKKVD